MTLTTIPYTRSFFRGSKQIMGVANATPMKTYVIPATQTWVGIRYE